MWNVVIKNIVCIFLLGIFFCSCKDQSTELPLKESDEGEIEMLFRQPHTYAVSDTDKEEWINELDLLIFKEDAFLYRRKGYRSGSSFRSTLKIDQELTIYFIANASVLIEECSALIEGSGKSWEDIQSLLILDNVNSLSNKEGLPMWGLKEDVTIISGANRLGNISLLRSVASVDIYNNANTASNEKVFELTGVYVYFAADQGFLAPTPSNYVVNKQDVNFPEAPAGMLTSQMILKNQILEEKVEKEIYLYENPFTSSTENNKRYTRLVIEGKFKGGERSYYPVDFYDQAADTMLQVTRNHKYIIEITSVESPGYPDPDHAKDEYDARMKVNIIEWNLKEDKHIVFDGPFYMSIESREVFLSKQAGNFETLRFSTNIAKEKLNFEFLDKHNGEDILLSEKMGVKNDRFQVEVVMNQQDEIEGLMFTPLGNYIENVPAGQPSPNENIFRISSSRIQVDVAIYQTDKLLSNWIQGDGKEVDLGESE